MSTARTLTLADVAVPRSGTLANVALVVAASLLTALAARIEIPLPWSPVPITGQTFAVLLSGAVLGARRGALSQALYLGCGAIGLPVFAAGAAGPPTAGYLLAFPLAAALTGALAEHGWDRRFASMFLAMLLGSTLILGCGVAVLARFVPAPRLFAAGVLPFLPGELIKCALAAIAFPAAWRRARRP